MARPGRKRRFPVVEPREVDRGTPELQAKRALVVGAEPYTAVKWTPQGWQGHIITKGDLSLAQHPLSILFANGIIGREHMDAGIRYGVLRWQCFGKPTERPPVYGEHIPGDDTAETDEEAMIRVRQAYEATDVALKRSGRKVYDETVNATIYLRMPGWYVRKHYRRGDERCYVRLIDGLTVLANHFGMYAKAA